MTNLPFDPSASILTFSCIIEYASSAVVNLCLDTGASTVIIREKVLTSIGFDLAAVPEKATFGDASTSHIVPIVMLKSLRSCFKIRSVGQRASEKVVGKAGE